MGLRLYNTLTREKEEFESIEEGKVGVYTCGPTVYSEVHIGNWRTFLFEDVLVRYLVYLGYEVKKVMNLTDVDDKTIEGARRVGKSLGEYTKGYEEGFFRDLKGLGLWEGGCEYPKATDHIEEMVELIEKLMEKGLAYRSGESIYFRIQEFKGYGRLSGMEVGGLCGGGLGGIEVDEYGKEDVRDFVLWKGYKEEEGEVYWETSLGKGRPGWHIECSAMSMKYLGKNFDIHCGGVDNIFPHHENEIAQSEGVYGGRFVNYWMHSEFLTIKGEKASKSLENSWSLSELLEEGFKAREVRFSLIKHHYRTRLEYSREVLRESRKALRSLNDFMGRCEQSLGLMGDCRVDIEGLVGEFRGKFGRFMDDDLNTSGAIGVIFELMRECHRSFEDLGKEGLRRVMEFFGEVDGVLGFLEGGGDMGFEGWVLELLKKREVARLRKDYEEADRLREELKGKGVWVEDTARGPIWKRIQKEV